MKQHLTSLFGAAPVLLLVCTLPAAQAQTITPSASSTLVAQPVPDRSLRYGVADPGTSKQAQWGLDTAWPSTTNMRRGVLFMGAPNVDIIRAAFEPSFLLVNNDLQQTQIDNLNQRLTLIGLAGQNKLVTLGSASGTVDPGYLGNAARWADLIAATTRRVQAAGHTVVTVSPFNEPDYGWGQYSGSYATGKSDFFNICGELRKNPLFNNIRLSGGNTLSADAASTWYSYLKTRLEESNTHQLSGSFDNFAAFQQTSRADGKRAISDEMHNVAEAMIGVEYGLQTGIWWGTAELARGEFVRANHGVRLGYAEHRPNWTAASVYRHLNGTVQAFGGTSERQARTTTYRFVSNDRDVYYEGYGPQREYIMELPGGTGYQQGQTNAERVVNITWGEDIQPAITSGQYILVNRSTGQVIQVPNGSMTQRDIIQQGPYTGAPYQQWNIAPRDGRTTGGDFSYFSMTAVHSAMALEELDLSLEDGASIIQNTDIGRASQQHYFEYTGNGWFRIRSRNSSKCLDLAANGVDVVQQAPSASLSQQWRLLPVGTAIEFVAPSAPANLVATARPESVRLSWTASPEADVAGYNILRADAAAGPYNTIARKVNATAFVDNTATITRQYFYKVQAVDNSLNRSASSNQVAATTTGAPDLVTQLRFDGNSLDSSPNLNHSALFTGTSYVAGRVGGNALALDGTTGFVQLPATVANQTDMTVAAWVYWNGGAAYQRVFDFGNDDTETMLLTVRSINNTLRFSIVDNGVDQSIEAPMLPTGVWSHVAVTLGSTGARLYVNGVQVAQSTTFTARPIDFKPVSNYIGRAQAVRPMFNGQIDDFGIYNYALTSADIAALAQATTTWTGNTGTNWTFASNWTDGVPNADRDAIVPANAVRYPLISGGTATMRGLTLGGTITQTGGTFDVGGDLTNNGTFTATGGTVRLGVAGQAGGPRLLGSSPTRFWNLEVLADGATVGTTAGASVQRVLTLTGSLVTQGNPLTVESDATGTGMVVSNGGAVFGNATVQRYVLPDLNPGMGYRHFTPPVTGATVAGLATASFTPVVNPAYNSSATPGTTSPFPTVFGYDQGRLATVTSNYAPFDKGWFSPTALSDVLAKGQGYTLQTSAGQTLSLSGPLNDGPVAQALTRTAGVTDAGWQLLGNPYPSPLDYSLVAPADRTGLDDAIYVFESTGPYAGNFRSYANGVGGNPLLALGQAFFARVSDGTANGTLTFRNEQRVTSYQNPIFHRTAAETRPLVQLTLQGSGPVADHAYVYFQAGATDGFDRQFDAVKMPNTSGLNVSTSLSTRQLSIDGRNGLGNTQHVVPLAVGVPVPGSYTLTATQLLNLGAVPTYLRDLQTGAVVDLAQQPSYSFTIGNASALITGRFELVLSPQQALATAPAALAQQVALYPNPATGSVLLELPASLSRESVTATLVDAVGREVRTFSFPAQGAGAHTLDLHSLPAGVYALQLRTGAGTITKRLTVQ